VGGDLLDHDAVLGHRKGVLADGLAVPPRNPGQAVGDVLDLNVKRRGVEQIQASARQHALPGADFGLFLGALGQIVDPARWWAGQVTQSAVRIKASGRRRLFSAWISVSDVQGDQILGRFEHPVVP
jgi:hypothetical protein